MIDSARWERLASAESDAVNLAEGALLIAAQECDGLDVDEYLGRIDEMGAALKRRLRSDISTTETVLALNRYLFDELGFSGNAVDYYDPRNSYLNEVIDRKLGIPITLAVLYIEIGRRIGLRLEGVSFPSHFLVKCVLREGAIILDPFARGASLGLQDLQLRLQEVAKDAQLDETVVAGMLSPALPKEIFSRMLRNLRVIHAGNGEPLKALSASNRIVALLPDVADEYRERGELYAELECFRAALADLQRYLELRPQAPDRNGVTRRIAELQPLAASLN